MSEAARAPAGFALAGGEAGTLFVARGCRAAFEAAGFSRAEAWIAALAGGASGAGRGTTARLELGDRTVRLKQLRRGGLVGPLWRERFVGRSRVLDNLRLPIECAARGLATAAPLALYVLEGPRRLWRGWMAFEELPNARSLAQRLGAGEPVPPPVLAAVLRTLRAMHDAGIEHRDLNAGNVLVDESAAAAPLRVFVIDLDRARLHPGPAPLAARRAGLRRLERSWLKLSAVRPGFDFAGAARLYAAGDTALEAELVRGRWPAAARLALHWLSWRLFSAR